MSVRNVLNGTIKVGGDGSMPVEPVVPEDLEVTSLQTKSIILLPVDDIEPAHLNASGIIVP